MAYTTKKDEEKQERVSEIPTKLNDLKRSVERVNDSIAQLESELKLK